MTHLVQRAARRRHRQGASGAGGGLRRGSADWPEDDHIVTGPGVGFQGSRCGHGTAGVLPDLPHDLRRQGHVPLGVDLGHVGLCMTKNHLRGFQSVGAANLGSAGVA